MTDWTFLTNHATALLCIAHNPDLTLRRLGDYVGITERAAHRIVSDLVDRGYLVRTREGRRNRYQVRPEVRLRDPLLRDRPVGQLLSALPVDLSQADQGAGRLGALGSAPAGLAAGPSITP